MQFVRANRKRDQRQRWQRFWPRSLLVLIAIVQMIFTIAIFALEFWSMIINIKYSFFFIGFIASFVFTITWISTFIVACCCRKSKGCAAFALVAHVLSIGAASVLLFYDIRFLRNSYTCLWPNGLCNGQFFNINFFGVAVGTSTDIHWAKFTSIKIQIACAAVLIVTCVLYIVIYIYTIVRVHMKNTVADSHTIIELGRVQQPPPPHWPEPPRELPPDSEF